MFDRRLGDHRVDASTALGKRRTVVVDGSREPIRLSVEAVMVEPTVVAEVPEVMVAGVMVAVTAIGLSAERQAGKDRERDQDGSSHGDVLDLGSTGREVEGPGQ